jgi:hypothetical protein
VNSNITISSNHATGTTVNTSLTAQVILNGTPNLVLQPNCYILNSEFQTKQIVISNTGNAPLYIENITSNDACIKSSWEDIKTKWIIGSDGTSVQVRDPYVIPVGASSSFSVQLQCPLNSNNNWDTVTDLRINQYNYQTGVTSFAGNIYIRRYQSQCPN